MNTGMRSDTASTAASTNLHDFSECNPFSASAGQTIQERATSAIHRLLNSQALPRSRRAYRAQKLYRNDAFAKGKMLRIPNRKTRPGLVASCANGLPSNTDAVFAPDRRRFSSDKGPYR